MPSVAAIQHSIITLENGNAIVHVSDKAENIALRVNEVLAKFKIPYRVRCMDLSESEGLTTLSLVLTPAEDLGEGIFVYRADRALFFTRIDTMLGKFGILENDVSKVAMAESMGYITAAYSYDLKEKKNV